MPPGHIPLLFLIVICVGKVFPAEFNGCSDRYSFRCRNGSCIKETAVCDGAKDCEDGSDESSATCSKLSVECPTFAFRCAYGACIDKKKTCDGVRDCADNSDEILPECRVTALNSRLCKKNEFKCNSGQCIDVTLLCDGSSDCSDATDETITQCINFRCPSFSFQCAYGACIDNNKKCNGVEDCIDGSDEDSDLCVSPSKPTATVKPYRSTSRPSTPSPELEPINGCPLPQKSFGGNYEVVECNPGDRSPKCEKIPGTLVKLFTVIRFFCSDGFALPVLNAATSFCDRNGKWNPQPAECKKLCPPLETDSVDLRCKFLGSPINCTSIMKHGTTVTARCKPAFHPVDHSAGFTETECLSDGTWANQLFTCIPECGIKNRGQQLISHAPQTAGEYPWHAGLYRSYGKHYICGGTIITPKAILTAAHCVYDELVKKIVPTDDFRVAVGKFTRSWNVTDPNEQRFEVREIIIRDTYLGSNNRFEHDIAVLSLRKTISISATVMPVCIDRYHQYHMKDSDLGTVVGWGFTEAGSPSEKLRVAMLPYYNFRRCRDVVTVPFSTFISYDKFCAGLHNGTHLGSGDSGGGLTFPVKVYNKDIHYLYGIVSVTDRDNPNITAFTNVTEHVPWFERVLDAIKKNRIESSQE